MSFAINDLMLLIERFLLPFIRLGALFVAAPFFGAVTVPVRVRIILAIAVTVILLPLLGDTAPVELLSAAGILAILQQVAVGLGMARKGWLEAHDVLNTRDAAGFLALCIAMLPARIPGESHTLVSRLHTAAAILFFLCIAYVAVFRASDTLPLVGDARAGVPEQPGRRAARGRPEVSSGRCGGAPHHSVRQGTGWRDAHAHRRGTRGRSACPPGSSVSGR